MKPIRRFATPCLVALALLYTTGCATNPVTGKSELRLVPESMEISIGNENYMPSQQSQGGLYITRPEVAAYVSAVGKKVAAVADRSHLPYEFVVLNNSEPNAWALPGGKIAINRGILAEFKSEAELAAVIAHEIVHSAARHGAKNMERGIIVQAGVLGLGLATQDSKYNDLIMLGSQIGAGMLMMKYSRSQELEADYYGMKYMSKAGYDTQAAVELQEMFVRLFEKEAPMWIEGLFASHPPSRERVEANVKSLAEYPPGGFRGEAEYNKVISGLRNDTPAYKLMDDGAKALESKQFDVAIQKAKAAMEIQPNEAMFYALAAAGFEGKNQYRNALTMLNRAIAIHSDYYEFYLMRGNIKKKLGDRTAKEDLQRSQQLLPTATASNMLGHMALAEGDRNAAMNYFHDAARAESEAGQEARVQYTRLKLEESPGEFLAFDARLDRQGRAEILIQNNAPLALRKIVVQVQSRRDGRKIAFQIPGPLDPGAIATTRTVLGPYPSGQALYGDLLLSVVSAETAE